MKIFNTKSLFFLFLMLGLISRAQNNGTYLIQSPENNLVMEVDNQNMHKNGVKVYLKSPNGKATQKWMLTKDYKGYYSIINMANNKAMSIVSFDQNKDGNSLILNTPDNSKLQKWSLQKDFISGNITIINLQNNKVLAPVHNAYKSASRIVLNRMNLGKKQKWILTPVTETNRPGYRFEGRYKKLNSNVVIEIKSTGRNRFKAFFSGSCKDESLIGNINANGVLVIPLQSSNNARLEIRNLNTGRISIRITNPGQFGIRNATGRCSGGMIEGTYQKQPSKPVVDFSGVFQKTNGNQEMQVVNLRGEEYKVIFRGNCNAETLAGIVNQRGELEIPLRGGYNDKLFIRKNGNYFNVRITNRNIMNRVCNGGSLEGNYQVKPFANTNFTGWYHSRSGSQQMEIIKLGYNSFKARFSGTCNAETLAGKIDSRGVLVIPLRGGYNDKIEIKQEGNSFRLSTTNPAVLRRSCNGNTVEGYYVKNDGFNGGVQDGFTGRFKIDYGNQQVVITKNNRNAYTAFFSGNCNVTAVTGRKFGNFLEFPIEGSFIDKLRIRKTGDGIRVEVANISAMRKWCKGFSFDGVYRRVR